MRKTPTKSLIDWFKERNPTALPHGGIRNEDSILGVVEDKKRLVQRENVRFYVPPLQAVTLSLAANRTAATVRLY